jgi:hypothetical protein
MWGKKGMTFVIFFQSWRKEILALWMKDDFSIWDKWLFVKSNCLRCFLMQ